MCVALWLFSTRFIQFGPRKSFVYFYGIISYLSCFLITASLMIDHLNLYNLVNWNLVIRLLVSLCLFSFLSIILCLVDFGGSQKQERVASRLPLIGLLITPLVQVSYFGFYVEAVLILIFYLIHSKRADLQMLYRQYFAFFIVSTLLNLVFIFSNSNFLLNNFAALILLLIYGKAVNDLMVKDLFKQKVNFEL